MGGVQKGSSRPACLPSRLASLRWCCCGVIGDVEEGGEAGEDDDLRRCLLFVLGFVLVVLALPVLA